MSEFKGAEAVKIVWVEKHPNADSLDIVKLEGKSYNCIVKSGRWKEGQFGIYIPEQAVVPDTILERIGMKGKLSGSQGNRVKAVKLRGILSQGLLLSLDEVLGEELYNEVEFYGSEPLLGEDISSWVGIEKYEPPIPVNMNGELINLSGKTINFDIENIKNHPDVFEHGEEVVITEKIHGTFVCMGWHPKTNNDELYGRNTIIHSKGLGAKGLAFKWNEKNEGLVYHRAFKKIEIEFLDCITSIVNQTENPVYLLGEVYGRGVQDFSYNEQDVNIRFFDIYSGYPKLGHYYDAEQKYAIFAFNKLPYVPVLYKGPYRPDIVEYYTDLYNSGKETVSGNGTNIREGIVITPTKERYDNKLGRVILKSVSERYLTRKKGTEYV